MSEHYLGIDISKDSFHVALLGAEQTVRGEFVNGTVGFGKLKRWLKKKGADCVHACMEATGRYWLDLALFLHEQGHLISVVNPRLIHQHGRATMQRNKTDSQDALNIADYCAKHQPAPWEPPSVAFRQLQALVRHAQALKRDRAREKNRSQSGISSPEVLAAIEAHITFLDQQIIKLEQQINDHIDQNPDLKKDRELLLSIPGIGETTAAVFLAEIPDVSLFAQANELAAFVGLTPGQRQSGTSLKAPARLVKWGNPRLRAALFMPALSAHVSNPIVAALRERLLMRGKTKMTVVVAVMRKLVHLCYGVLKTGKPFDPNHTQMA